MIHGLYLSARGLLANSHRQDIIANNLANAETVGFKRDLAVFQEQRLPRSSAAGGPYANDPLLEGLGGGLAVSPTAIDISQGDLESTGSRMDLAVRGEGFLAVRSAGRLMLTRDGRLTVNSAGHLALAAGGQEVLDVQRRPIPVDRTSPITISRDGTVSQGKTALGQIGVFDIPEPGRLVKRGQGLMAYPELDRRMQRRTDVELQQGFVERGNVASAKELAALMDAQRQLEANANLIRYQDQTLGRLVNDVCRIG
jgi:flagellar basal-body rod protein FlgF